MPAKIISAEKPFFQSLFENNDPGPYLLGVGDTLIIKFAYISDSAVRQEISDFEYPIFEDGSINVFDIGKLKVAGMTLPQIEDLIYRNSLKKGQLVDISVNIKSFLSKKIYVSGTGIPDVIIPYTSIPIYLEDLTANNRLVLNMPDSMDAKISIYRDSKRYDISYRRIMLNLECQNKAIS